MSELRTITDWWLSEYQKHHHEAYDFVKADGVILARLNKRYSGNKIMSAITRFLSVRDAWVEAHTGYTVKMFKSKFNQLILDGSRVATRAGKYDGIVK